MERKYLEKSNISEREAKEHRDKKGSGSGVVGMMVVAHLFCCGIPLLVIVLGSAGAGALISMISSVLIPVGGAIVLTGFAWGFYRYWKKRMIAQNIYLKATQADDCCSSHDPLPKSRLQEQE